MTRTIHFVRRNPAAIALLVLALLLLTTLRVQAAENGKILFRPGSGLATINPDGSDEVHFPGGLDARWSPDGRRIAYAGVYVANADGSNPQLITAGPPGEDRNPQWSPDGSKIAFTSNRDGNQEIYVVNVDDKEETRLTNHAAVDARPQWSPDGSKIVFESYRDGNANIYFVDVTSGALTQVTTDPQYDLEPDWSPSGDKIAFGRTGGIFVKELGSGAEQQLTFGATEKPLWSPDGSRIAFIRFIFVAAGLSHRDVYVVNADGSNPVNVAFAVDQNTALGSWSPDGLQVVYRKRNSPAVGIDIYRTVADGSGEFKVTNIFGTPSDPQWGPAFVSVSPPEVIEPADSGPFTELPVHAEGTCESAVTVDWYDDQDVSVDGISDPCLDGTWSHDADDLTTGTYTLKVCNAGTAACAEKEITVELPTGPQEIKVAVILAEPRDESFDTEHDKAYFESGIIPAVRHYWCEASFGEWDGSVCTGGEVNLVFDVYDKFGQKYKLPENKFYYGHGFDDLNVGNNFDNDETVDVTLHDRTQEYVWDALEKAATDPEGEQVNLNQYEMGVVVYEGASQQILLPPTADPAMITEAWGEYWPVSLSPRVKTWVSVSEDDEIYEWAHEIGHVLGYLVGPYRLCDLYPGGACQPVQGSIDSMYQGDINDWGLMGETFLRQTFDLDPPFPSSYSQMRLGWHSLAPNPLTTGSHSLEALTTQEKNDPVAWIDLGGGDYYLIEGRTNDPDYSTWDTNAPETALVVYKVEKKSVSLSGAGSGEIDVVNIVQAIDSPVFSFADFSKRISISLNAVNESAEDVFFDFNLLEPNSTDKAGILFEQDVSFLERLWENLGLGSPHTLLAQADSNTEALEMDLPSDSNQSSFLFSEMRKLFWYILLGGLLILLYLGNPRRWRERRVFVAGVAVTVVIVLLAIWVFVLVPRVVGATIYSPAAGSPTPISAGGSNPDLDLHAYDDQGNHVGVNYETGEYEIGIPGAEVSGDLWLGDEWIFVPEGTQVRYEIVAEDTRRFLEENPGIAAELEDVSETYSVQAITYDADSDRFESEVVENIAINPGETRIHEIGGTVEEPTVDEGTLLVPFAEFDVEDVFGDEEDMEIVGEFTLGAATDGINPLAEGATVRIGEFIATIPGEDFEPQGGGEVEFDGTIGGIELEIEFTPRSNNRYDFEIELEDANVGDVSDPVTFHIAVGGDFGTTDVLIPEDD